MKIATWNINGIRARHGALCDWLDEVQPEVVCLQELKAADGAFPTAMFEDRGYNVATHGQKSFNGVAILSKYRWRMSPAACPAMTTTRRPAGSRRR